MNTTRRFTHKTGFLDNTDYIEVGPGGNWLVSEDGTRSPALYYDLDFCLKSVAEGKWKEITGATLQCGEFAVSIADPWVEYRYVFPLGGHRSIQNVADALAFAFNVPCPEGVIRRDVEQPTTADCPTAEPPTGIGGTGTPATRRPLTPAEIEILKQADITDWSGLYFAQCKIPFKRKPTFLDADDYTTTWTPDQIKSFRKWRALTELEVKRLRLAKPNDVSGFRLTGWPGVLPDFTAEEYETTLTPGEVLALCWRTPTEAEFAAFKTWNGWDWEQIAYRGDKTAQPCSFVGKRQDYRTTLTDIRPWRVMTALEAKVAKPGPRVVGDKTYMTEAEFIALL